MYRYVASSVVGFVQQLAVGYVQHGHLFYVSGSIPERKEPAAVDEKLIRRYDLDVSKWTRARRKDEGRASVQYIRFGRFFVLIATRGRHEFFEQEDVKDIRRNPIRFVGYSIGYKRGVDRKWHASVRIAPDEYLRLKSHLVGLAVHRSVDNFAGEFKRIPFEPYAPVRRQLLNILRAVNRARGEVSFEPVPVSVLRLRRRVVKPFGDREQSALGELRQEVSGPDSEGLGKTGKIDDGDVSLPPFDAADVVSVEAALEGKLLLRPAPLSP